MTSTTSRLNPNETLNTTLTLSPEEMRTLGYQVIDMVVRHYETLPDRPVGKKVHREDLEPLFREAIPQTGTEDPAALIASLERSVFDQILHLDHPRFFGYVPGPSNYVSFLGDILASGFNVFNGSWLSGSSASQIELVMIEWLHELFDFPKPAGGLFVSGGSMANLIGLLTARHMKLEPNLQQNLPLAVAYLSDQTHSSVERALKFTGLTDNQIRKIPSDAQFRLDLNAFQTQLQQDLASNLKPYCVVANAGTTNTGSVDPLDTLADICAANNLWLHLDGAYGAAAYLCDRGKTALEGLSRADSITIDPHKWLFQPYEMGCILVRDHHWMRESFHILPEYLRDVASFAQSEEVNFMDYGVELTRRFRALKLWLSLKVFGLQAFQGALTHGFEQADFAEQTLKNQMPDTPWEIISPSTMGVIAFRYAPEGFTDKQLDALNQQAIDAVANDGFALISSTILKGKKVMRLCCINPRNTQDDIEHTLAKLASAAAVAAKCFKIKL